MEQTSILTTNIIQIQNNKKPERPINIKCEPEFDITDNNSSLPSPSSSPSMQLTSQQNTVNEPNESCENIEIIPEIKYIKQEIKLESSSSSSATKRRIEPPKKPQQLPIQCDICMRSFDRNSAMIRHRTTHTNKTYKCVVCHEIFYRLIEFKKHIEIHPNDKPFPCPYCPKSYFSKKSIDEHVQIHSNEMAYKCKTCSKTFNSAESVRYHERMHRVTTPLECSVCSKTFVQKKLLNNHMKTHAKPYKCDMCLREFSSKFVYSRHTVPVGCDICPMEFNCSNSLKEHTNSHRGDGTGNLTLSAKVFKCELCAKVFNRNAKLTEHMLTHTKVRPFQCLTCSKTFATKRSYLDHMNFHEGIHKCEHCGQVYSRKPNLIAHMKVVHMGEKPYKCEICSLEFSYRNSFVFHMKVHGE